MLHQQKQKDLINILLRNGYIDEDYLYYISIFYEGSLSQTDHQFLINVQTQKSTDFDYSLIKTEKLIEKIDRFEFDKEYILNYDLVEFLISNKMQIEKREHLFSQLINETDISIEFIDGFIDFSDYSKLFIQYLCEQWVNIWSFIEDKSTFSEDKKEKYFKLIIQYANIKDIEDIFSNFKSIFSGKTRFLSIIEDANRLKEIIKVLNIKFSELSISSPRHLLDYVYEGNYYAITPKMLEVMLMHNDAYKPAEFHSKNYSSIKISGQHNLIKYMENNINEYIASVYLKLESNHNESLEYLLELLNNNDISIENKDNIITLTETVIDDLNEIEDLQVINLILKESKLSPTWENIYSVYVQSDNKLPDILIHFINISENAKSLSEKTIRIENTDEDTANLFMRGLLLENKLQKESYSYILNSISYQYPSLAFEELDYNKVQLLIENNILQTNNPIFVMLKKDFEGLQILLIENSPDTFIENVDTFEIENEDILSLLESTKLSIGKKEEIIECIDVSTFIDDPLLLTQIGNLLLENERFNLGENFIKPILIESDLSTSKKIGLFNKNSELFSRIDIDEIISSLDDPYSKIAETSKRPLIENNITNKKFATILKEKDYISKFEVERKKGIRISTFRNKR